VDEESLAHMFAGVLIALQDPELHAPDGLLMRAIKKVSPHNFNEFVSAIGNEKKRILINGKPYIKFIHNENERIWKSDVFPAGIHVLAHIMDEFQHSKRVTPREREFWPQHLKGVINVIGLKDWLLQTKRSRALLFRLRSELPLPRKETAQQAQAADIVSASDMPDLATAERNVLKAAYQLRFAEKIYHRALTCAQLSRDFNDLGKRERALDQSVKEIQDNAERDFYAAHGEHISAEELAALNETLLSSKDLRFIKE
jgi:hypothetical protein